MSTTATYEAVSSVTATRKDSVSPIISRVDADLPKAASPVLECVKDADGLSNDDYVGFDIKYGIAGVPAHPLVIERGLGAHVWDMSDRKYIDLVSGFSSLNQGHCHPRIVKAMVEQCQTIMLPGRAVHSKQYTLLCKKLCELFGLDRMAAMNSGSEAIDLAIKISRKWGYRVKKIPAGEGLIITATANYHGRSMVPLSSSDNPALKDDCGPFIPQIGPTVAGGKAVRYGNAADLEAALESHGDKVAAFMIEPVQGSAGCVVPPTGYLSEVRRLCSKYNVLLVLDEVQSGFGRTGHLMAYQAEDIKPDILVLGKSLVGGAYSMGVVVGIEEAMGCMRNGEHGSSFAGNPIACAVARAAVDVTIDEDLPNRARMLGDIISERLSSIESPYISAIQGRGCLWSIFIDENVNPERMNAKILASRLLERGVLTSASGNKIRVGPPLVISIEDMEFSLSQIKDALSVE